MSYVINANNTAGVISLHRDSAPAAVKKAQELIKEGLVEVKITAPDGSEFRNEDEFRRLMG
ncbi:MAG: hypothetical protein WBK91_10150 [Alphaproteobacteria bacterium]